jgi:hypothetical protein
VIVLHGEAEHLELGQEEVRAVNEGQEVYKHGHDLALGDVDRTEVQTARVVPARVKEV